MVLSSSLPNFPTQQSSLKNQLSSSLGNSKRLNSGNEQNNVLQISTLSQDLQEKLTKANLAFQTITKQIGSDFQDQSDNITKSTKVIFSY